MSNTKHTPTPWVVCGRDIEDQDGERLATTYSVGKDMLGSSSENAAFIVKAVNSYDQLVAALRRVIAATDSYSTLHAPDEDDVARMIEYAAAFDNARAALAAAEAA